MQERLSRSASIRDLPRFGGIDQTALRQLREEAAASSSGGPESGEELPAELFG